MKKLISFMVISAIILSTSIIPVYAEQDHTSVAGTHFSGADNISARYIPCPEPGGHDWVISSTVGCKMWICTLCGMESYIPF